MKKEKKFSLIILIGSIATMVTTGSVAFWLQQRIDSIDAENKNVTKQFENAMANWREAQRHIDLAVLNENFANSEMLTATGREHALHTVHQEIERAWFYKQLSITFDKHTLDIQKQLFSVAQNEENRLNTSKPVTDFFDNIFNTFETRLNTLEIQKDRLEQNSSKLRFWQLAATQLAVGLQVIVVVIAFFKDQNQGQKHK